MKYSVIIIDGIAIGWFAAKFDAEQALKQYLKKGYIVERDGK